MPVSEKTWFSDRVADLRTMGATDEGRAANQRSIDHLETFLASNVLPVPASIILDEDGNAGLEFGETLPYREVTFFKSGKASVFVRGYGRSQVKASDLMEALRF